MIDVATEKLKTLEQAAEKLMLPKATLVKWIKYGTKGIKLEAIKFGTHWRTSEEALQRFGDRQTPVDETTVHTANPSRTALQQKRHMEWVNEQLDELMGIKKCESCKKVVNVHGKSIPKKEKLLCPQCVVNEPKATMGQRLRTFRWNARLSQPELSTKTGISIESIRVYEKNEKTPTVNHLAKLIEVFGNGFVTGLDLE